LDKHGGKADGGDTVMRRIIAVMVCIMCAATALSGCALLKKKDVTVSTAEVREAEGTPVKIAKARSLMLASSIPLTGTVESPDEINLTPRVGGEVVAIYKDKGDYVRKGEPLLQIDTQDYMLGLRQAEAAHEMAKQNLAMARAGARPEELVQAQNMLAQAEAGFNVASKTYTRMKELYDKGVISKQELDGVEAQYISADKQYDNAKKQLEMAQTGARAEQVKMLEAQLRQAAVAVDNVKLALERATVKSPVDGVISYRMCKVGESTGPQEAVFQILKKGEKKISFTINEADLKKINEGDEVKFRAAGIPGVEYGARISYISRFVRKMTREAEGEAIIVDESKPLSHGMFVEGNIILPEQELFAIPFKSLVENSRVTVVEGDKAVIRKCSGAKRILDYVQITDECVKPGDMILIEGQGIVKDGQKVKILETLEY